MMLTIRKAQMDEMARVRIESFERRLTAHLREVLRERVAALDDIRLEEQVRRGVASGLRFFKTEKDLTRYCEIVLTILGGWQEQDHPEPALEILRPDSIEAGQRLANFERWVGKKGRRR